MDNSGNINLYADEDFRTPENTPPNNPAHPKHYIPPSPFHPPPEPLLEHGSYININQYGSMQSGSHLQNFLNLKRSIEDDERRHHQSGDGDGGDGGGIV